MCKDPLPFMNASPMIRSLDSVSRTDTRTLERLQRDVVVSLNLAMELGTLVQRIRVD